MAWGGNHFTPLLPFYQEHSGLSPTETNLLLGYYVAGLVPGLLVTASLSDQFGRKPLTLVGLVASLIGNAVIIFGVSSLLLLNTGRALAGLSVGIGMSVGTSWIKELSSRPWDMSCTVSAGAKRPSITMTAGFAIGALATGVLVQWAPAPTTLPFVLFVVLAGLSLFSTAMAPETVGWGEHQMNPQAPWYRQLRTPSALHKDFLLKVAPAAPWVFGAGGIAYGLMPQIMEPHVGNLTTAYATLLSVTTLGVGVFFQPVALKLDRITRGRALPLGMLIVIIGLVGAAFGSEMGSPIFAVAVAVLLGIGYGSVLVTGLSRVQQMAPAQELAGLTGIYYSLTYIGFLFPTILASMTPEISYQTSILGLAGIAFLCLLVVGGRTRYRRGPITGDI